MRRVIRLLVAVVIAGQAFAAPADEVPGWPSQQELRLEELKKRSAELQQKLFAARMQQQQEEAKRLSRDARAVKDERFELMRALGQMPPAEEE